VFSTLFAQFPKLPDVVELDEGEKLLSATSRILVTHGPFAITRNPMFLSGLIVLLGWVGFYGNVSVLILAVLGEFLWIVNRALRTFQSTTQSTIRSKGTRFFSLKKMCSDERQSGS
jgi:hypothetical protein